MTIFFTVTNDLNYDQRMIRICTSLALDGHTVRLIGRKMKGSAPLEDKLYEQVRLNCIFEKGRLFYAFYNIRLFIYLLLRRADCICAIDLDSILPCLWVSKIRKAIRVYDAHELFCEMKEIVSRPRIYRFWKKIERYAVPKFKNGYTVNQLIADEFRKMYGVDYGVIRSIALREDFDIPAKEEKYILYQGAVNEGRSFETLIPAMKSINLRLVICGDGNFMEQANKLVADNQLEDKVIFMGKLPPEKLRQITRKAWIGVTLFDDMGMSNYYSLANRFSDYMHAAIPQVCVDYPVYRQINDEFGFALMIKDVAVESITTAINNLLNNETLYYTLQQNCIKAGQVLNWQEEEKKLLAFYNNIQN